MSSDSKKTGTLSRRCFLKKAVTVPLAGMSAPPALALFAAILEGQCHEAWAASTGLNPRTFVNITAGGGPARWMYNNFLNPYDSPIFNPHPMIASNFKEVAGRYTQTEYATHTIPGIAGIHVPTIFTYSVPKPGGYRPMSDLLKNMLCIQGIDTRNAGHFGSQYGAYLPPGSKQSAAALSADVSDLPFAAINLGGASFKFKSIANKSAVSSAPVAGISGLLASFKSSGSAQYQSDKKVFRTALNEFLGLLDDAALNGHLGAQTIIENRESAIKLTETNFTQLDSQWATLVAKYKDLIDRSLMCESGHLLPGLNDKPVGEGANQGDPKHYELDYTSPLGINSLTDFRLLIGNKLNLPLVAESFALTEYILVNQLSSSISLNIPNLDGLTFAQVARLSMPNDSHTAGIFPHTMLSTLRHRAGAACILELIEQLKAKNLFNNVVIREAGEFNRYPLGDLAGSNHGQIGLSQTFYCGAFTAPLIVGNFAKGSGSNHWGAGGIIPSLNRKLYLTDAIATLAHLIGVPSPLTSANSVVTLTSNGLVSLIGTTQYI